MNGRETMMLDAKTLNLNAILAKVEPLIQLAASQGKFFTWVKLNRNVRNKLPIKEYLEKQGFSCMATNHALYIGWNSRM